MYLWHQHERALRLSDTALAFSLCGSAEGRLPILLRSASSLKSFLKFAHGSKA
jgi:hypothetical protein